MRVAVLGGGGTVGRHVVARLQGHGHDARALGRSTGVDVTTGAGLAAALAEVESVVDVTNLAAFRRSTAVRRHQRAAHEVQRACARSGVRHLVLLSIVGIDRVTGYGYYAGKLAQERIVLSGEVPWTLLRATQFHELVRTLLTWTRFGVGVVPRARVQPVAAATVGAALADLAVSQQAHGRVADLAGPRAERLVDLARAVAAGRDRTSRVAAVGVPGSFGRALRAGALLPGPDATLSGPDFATWLTAQ